MEKRTFDFDLQLFASGAGLNYVLRDLLWVNPNSTPNANPTTGPAFATGIYTLTDMPTDGDTNTYVIGGFTVHSAQATANDLTAQAAADALAINGDPDASTIVHATSALGVITITALAVGPSGNAITTTGSSDGGDTVTAGQAALAGGAGYGDAGNDSGAGPFAVGGMIAVEGFNYTKLHFEIDGPGRGYTVTLLGTSSPLARKILRGAINPGQAKIEKIPTILPPTEWNVLIGPAQQSGEGEPGNPLTDTNRMFNSSGPLVAVRAVLTAVGDSLTEYAHVVGQLVP